VGGEPLRGSLPTLASRSGKKLLFFRLGPEMVVNPRDLPPVSEPPPLSEAEEQRLLDFMRAGTAVNVARAAAGIDPERFQRWARAESARLETARAEVEARLVTLVAVEARKNWQAAAWMLERDFPERWAKLSQRERLVEEERPAVEADPFAEVDELAERRRNTG
jgi:hypothetical protein